MNNLTIRPTLGPDEYDALKSIWRSAVDATHTFLTSADRDDIESHLTSDYFPAVKLTVAVDNDIPVGFAGTLEGNLEMLFVEATRRGRGIGSTLLAHVITNDVVRRVDVNEQNEPATEFYVRQGFQVVSRSEVDDAGRPYPILNMSYPD